MDLKFWCCNGFTPKRVLGAWKI